MAVARFWIGINDDVAFQVGPRITSQANAGRASDNAWPDRFAWWWCLDRGGGPSNGGLAWTRSHTSNCANVIFAPALGLCTSWTFTKKCIARAFLKNYPYIYTCTHLCKNMHAWLHACRWKSASLSICLSIYLISIYICMHVKKKYIYISCICLSTYLYYRSNIIIELSSKSASASVPSIHQITRSSHFGLEMSHFGLEMSGVYIPMYINALLYLYIYVYI